MLLLLVRINCPHCLNEYQVVFQSINGFTKDIKSAYEIYYQNCPHCGKPIAGLYLHPILGCEFDFEKRKN